MQTQNTNETPKNNETPNANNTELKTVKPTDPMYNDILNARVEELRETRKAKLAIKRAEKRAEIETLASEKTLEQWEKEYANAILTNDGARKAIAEKAIKGIKQARKAKNVASEKIVRLQLQANNAATTLHEVLHGKEGVQPSANIAIAFVGFAPSTLLTELRRALKIENPDNNETEIDEMIVDMLGK